MRIRRVVLWVLLIVVCAQPALLCAAIEDYEGRRVAAVRFDPANQPLAESDLNKLLAPLAPGRVFRYGDMRAAIESLYGSGRYDDVAVDARLEGDGVVLTFVTSVSRFVRDVRVEGVPEPPNQGQLAGATRLELGAAYSDAQLKQATENILESLRSNGFYLAKITPETEAVPIAQQIDITLNVDPGKRAKYSRPIIAGNLKLPEKDLVKATHWRRFLGIGGWKPVTETRTSQGVDRVRRHHQKRDYLMARVSLEQMEYNETSNTVTPHLSVDSGPRVKIRTTGARVSKGKLRELVPVYQEQTVDKDLLMEGRRNLEDYFELRGYFDAEIEFDFQETGPNEQTIEYAIMRGERHKLTKLEITGNRYFNEDTLRERMYLMPASFLRFRYGRFSGDYLRRDVNAIKDLYRANGFRDAQVNSRVERVNETELEVYLNVEEGPQWFVNQLEIVGASETALNYIQGVLQSMEGQPFSDYNVAQDQDTILSYYYNSGFPDARFDAIVTPATEPHRMNLRYVISEGERQFVRDVLISGLDNTDPELVRNRTASIKAGDPLSQSSMNEAQRRLYDLGIFARVDTAIQNPEGETDAKYVLYRIEEARRWSLTSGFGAEIARIGRGSAQALAAQGTAGFSPRVSLGINRGNFLGQGHTVSLQTRLSRIQRRALATYLAPQFKGNENLSLTFNGLYDDSRDVNTFNARRLEASVQLQQRFSKANSAQYRVAWRRVSVTDVIIPPELIGLLTQPVQLGVVSGTFIQDRRDDPTDARRGVWNTGDVALASNVFGSKTSFLRSIGRNATYHRIGREMVFARVTQLGGIAKISRLDVPLPERIFGGGGASHRGFGENQAGPRDPFTGFPQGGRGLLLNTLELRFPLIGENIGGVLFHDAGNVYSSLSDVSFRLKQDTTRRIDPVTRAEYIADYDYMVHAVGFGLRYRTPIGPVRVDLAMTANPPQFIGFRGTREELLEGRGTRELQRLSRFQFHFSLGQAF